ncbi:FAD-dependent oxidoreductase [Kineococcus radiotolerans]|uniref:FAD dependent oxidoreductase n=1 Tax=Kineococcus radiotolerans (strain ATCC BAA-149 / DSM 14245 / SRS30216) TaxID=266940 RepID=A6WFK2_KINRD|nr:FAD-dependent oxidoreductase [Kineococcus radiotolerans]ABS05591.1 FAD dependent oxidoreductase [Kineococcus radiotolerans SRS30216 = ATCC BAA-149]
MSSQFLVVGAGLAGASAAWRLTERGCSVTLVERDVPASAQGSSHGSARIFRYAYPERTYVDLVAASEPGWAELEARHGAALVIRCGALDFGARRDPHGLAAVLAAAGVEHELVPREQARERWPHVAVDTDVLHHAAGGVLDAETTVRTMVAAARAGGAEVLTGWPLQRLERTGAGFTAHAADGRTLSAGRVVVSAGGWLPDLLGDLPLPAGFLAAFPRLEVREENAFHFPYRDAGADWPALIHEDEDLSVYALPGGRDAGFRGQKVAEFNGGRVLPSAAARTGVVDPANRARVVDHVRRFLPGLEPEPYAETTCLFTSTPTEDFVVDGAEGVTVLSPCSGHGAKFAPLLGEVAADVALGTGSVPERFRVGVARG